MSLSRRASFLAGASAAILAVLFCFQGITQKVVSQPAQDEPTYQESPARPFAPGEVIVALEPDASREDLRDLNQDTGASTEEDLPRSDVNVVDLPRDLTVREAVSAYENSPDVAYAEPNFRLQALATPDDPGFNSLWGLNNTGQTGGTADADIDAPEAWNATTGSRGTAVAVIDEGVDVGHPDLRDNIWTNPGEVAGNRVDDDRNGYVDDVNGYDFANNDAGVYDPDPITGNGDEHGTHVAGTIAASGDNGVGITGVNWEARIAALKFLGPGGGNTSDAVEAVNYAVAEGIGISNNSWGGGGPSQSLRDAIRRADASGHLFLAAAGNGGEDGVGDNNDVTPNFPSNYDVPNVVSVAATDDTDALASFSNFGAFTVDLAAPGVDILSTLPNNRYGRYSGTSMATPHVAGVAALIKSQNPALDDAQLKARILQNVDQKASLQNKVATDGRVNAFEALEKPPVAAPPATAEPPATEPPAVAPDAEDPTVTAKRPAPASGARDRTPTVRATVTDNATDLRKPAIQLYVDGRARGGFAYDTSTDRLSYTTPTLAYGNHTVKVVAKDAAGNVAAVRWGFRVVR